MSLRTRVAKFVSKISSSTNTKPPSPDEIRWISFVRLQAAAANARSDIQRLAIADDLFSAAERFEDKEKKFLALQVAGQYATDEGQAKRAASKFELEAELIPLSDRLAVYYNASCLVKPHPIFRDKMVRAAVRNARYFPNPEIVMHNLHKLATIAAAGSPIRLEAIQGALEAERNVDGKAEHRTAILRDLLTMAPAGNLRHDLVEEALLRSSEITDEATRRAAFKHIAEFTTLGSDAHRMALSGSQGLTIAINQVGSPGRTSAPEASRVPTGAAMAV